MKRIWLALAVMATSCRSTPSGPVTYPNDSMPVPAAPAPAAQTADAPVVATVRPFKLPLKRADLVNLERDILAKGLLADPDAALAALLQDGIAVGETKVRYDRFEEAYTALASQQVPVTVTSDSLLHLYHLYFAEVLKAVETRSLAPMLQSLVQGLLAHLESVGSRGGPLAAPVRNEVAFLSVALALLDPSFKPPAEVRRLVEADLKKIAEHKGLTFSHALSSEACVKSNGMTDRCYHEDFSQYVPRGHYTQSEALQRYFRASMWLGRVGHRFKYPDEVLQSALLLEGLKSTCHYDGKDVTAAELRDRIDRVLRFFIGASDDLTPSEVDPVFRKHAGGKDLAQLAGPDAMKALTIDLRALRAPRILSGAVEDVGADATGTVKQETQGLRLLGQRFAPDSEILGRLVYEFVGPDPKHPRYAEVIAATRKGAGAAFCSRLTPEEVAPLPSLSCGKGSPAQWRCVCEAAKELDARCKTDPKCRAAHPEATNESYGQVCRLMPTGLDVAASLGSREASDLLAPSSAYCGYEASRAALTKEARTRPAPDTLYLAWLDMLQPLLDSPGEGRPTWMRGKPYARKSLRTALASWTELRHDTILYVKQSYTMMVITDSAARPEPLEAKLYGTVEPLPELIGRMKRLAARTRETLAAVGALPDEVGTSIGDLEVLLGALDVITRKELREEALSAPEVEQINGIGKTFEALISRLTLAITPPAASQPPPQDSVPGAPEVQGAADAFKTTMVADVHTDLNSGRVLEEGLGTLQWMLTVNRGPDGKLAVSVGPVFSWYEFTHALSDRLTNEKWREMLASDPVPAPAWWTSGKPYANGQQLFCTKTTPGCEP